MKIILPINEKFLWELYGIFGKVDDIASFMNRRSLRQFMTFEFSEVKRRYQKTLGKKRFARLVYNLKRAGYIETPEWAYKSGIFLSDKGLERVARIEGKIKSKELRKDGKWEMAIFDIPEKKKYKRNILRNGLKKLGYRLLQKSIWVCPYDVIDKTEDLVRLHELEDEVKLLLIEEIKVARKV